ncbi:MAG: MaoC/PaaZ C-terminal domain-containing protein, partial [Chloroflexota bacterium]
MSKSRGLTFDQFNVGDSFTSQSRTVTEADVVSFAGLSGDFNPLHTDEEFARTTPFGTRIAHGMLVAAMATGMSNWTGVFEGTTLALMEQVIQYKAPTKFGDTVHL